MPPLSSSLVISDNIIDSGRHKTTRAPTHRLGTKARCIPDMISGLFLIDAKGDIVISRLYRCVRLTCGVATL